PGASPSTPSTADVSARAPADAASGTVEVFFGTASNRPDPNPGDDTATDVDAVTDPVDLSVTVDDGQSTALAGDLRTYEIVVTNLGARDATGTVTDVFPTELTLCSWTCVPGPGAGCTVQTVDGDLLDAATLPAGASVTYVAACVVDPALDPSVLEVVNVASVAAGAGAQDLVPENNTARDVNGGPAAVIFRADFESGDLSEWTAAVGGAASPSAAAGGVR
ncbi:MAG: hypothetical protein AAFX50_19065, partial [Acidobacteriota bacterium]